MTEPEVRPNRQQYVDAVFAYLGSDWGADTPADIAARLASLRPEAVGLSYTPTIGQLHNTRQFLQELQLMQALSECSFAFASGDGPEWADLVDHSAKNAELN